MRKKLLLISLIIPFIFSIFSVGMIRVTAAGTRDVAVLSVTPDPTSVKLGELVNITVVVENQGDQTETFSVTVYYDTNTIGTQSVTSLAAGANTSLTFVWDTKNVWIDTLVGSIPFKINATASTVAGETDTADNTLVSSDRVRVVKSPYIGVFPHCTVSTNLTEGTTYTVSIKTDYTGSDITGWQFVLYYNPSVLHGVSITNGDLITTDKHPDAKFNPGTFNNQAGKLTITSAFFFFMTEPAPITSGPGTLANVTFDVVGVGESSLTIGVGEDETKLKGYSGGGYGDPYDIVDGFVDADHIGQGYFRNSAAEVIHDVAVISVTPNATDVERGEPVKITVEIKNNGTTAEDVTVEVSHRPEATPPGPGSSWIIDTKTTQDLAADANTSLAFIWDTSGVRSGKHIITATAESVEGETNTEDNTLQSAQMVNVTVKGEKPIPLELIIGIAVAVVAVIVIVIIVLRRGRKPTPE